MKTLIILFLFPLKMFAQDITGLWTGFIHTTDKDLPYELAITENNGRLTGYTHTTFTVNGVEEIGVKAVTIQNNKGNVLVEDEALVYNDFSEAPAKGVRQSDFLTLIIEDTIMHLNGTFKTNKTKIYRSVTGSIQLSKTDTSKKTKIIPRLNELNLLNTLSFLQPKIKQQQQDVVIISKPEEKVAVIRIVAKQTDSIAVAKVTTSAPVLKSKQDVIQYTPVNGTRPAVIAFEKPKPTPMAQVPAIINRSQQAPSTPKPQVVVKTADEKKPPVSTDTKAKENANVQLPETAKKAPLLPPAKAQEKPVAAIPKSVNIKKEEPVASTQTAKTPSAQLPLPGIQPLPIGTSVISAAEVSKRKTETIRSVYFKSDSLVISLYDNGEVDGDVVSVILNGKVILANQMLTTNAITKTIYITPDLGDSLQLIMYAENLGSIPPNTGLLILQDGNDRYEIRFAGDFQKNSAVLLRRRKP